MLQLIAIALSIDSLKGSMEGTVTLNIKVWHGAVEPFTYRLKQHRQDLHQKMVDLLKFLRPKIKLCVIDAITPMEGCGPIYGKKVEGTGREHQEPKADTHRKALTQHCTYH